ncbi:MAG: AAA family ATPase [Infirmifilum uzonense]|uniref:AAA family ATPase n=1 Tax=Infirmifilum uzonense TaxID=1550241 RepID=UPI003C78DF2B
MVVIHSIKAVNFRRLNLTTPLSLGKGFYIIKGRNEAGKSTLIESILFGLYGDHQVIGDLRGNPRGGYNEVVNHKARRAQVEVEFEVDGKRYRVYRELVREGETIKQVNARLIEITQGTERVIASGTKQVNDEIQRLLRVSWREMLSTNIVAQKDLERIIQMGKSEREQIINLMMGLESYNKAIQALEETRSNKKYEKENLELKYSEKLQQAKLLEEKVNSIPNLMRELKEIEEKIPALGEEEAALKLALQYLAHLRQSLYKKKQLEEQKSRVEELIAETKKAIRDEQEKKNRNDNEIKQIERNLPMLQEELEKIQKELEQLQSTYEDKLKILSDLKSYKDNRDRELDRMNRISKELEALEDDIRRIESAQKELANLEEEKRKIELLLASIKPSIQPYLSSIGLAFIALLALLYQATWVAIPLSGVSLIVFLVTYHRRSSLKQELLTKLGRLESEIGPRKALVAQLEGKNKRLEDLKLEEEKIRAHLERLEQEILRLTGESHAASIDNALIALQKEVSRLSEKINELREKESNLKAGIESSGKQLERLKQEVKESTEKLEELNAKLSKLEEDRRKILEELEHTIIPSVPPGLKGRVEYVEMAAEEQDPDLVDIAYGKLDEDFQRISKEKTRLEERLETLKKELSEAEKIKPRLQELQEEIKKLEEDRKRLDKEFEAVKRALQALKEISRRRRELFAPLVENYMSWTINYFTDGRYKAVRLQPDTYDLEVYDAEAGRWLRRDIYSGGTNDQFLLALRIAFTLALLPSSKGSYPKFIVLDEPLGSSDGERRERIVSFFAGELSRFFDQIFLITHVEVEEPPGATIIYIEDGRITRVYKAGGEEA